MSGRAAGLKQKASANALDANTLTVNERILRECHSLYTAGENGLVAVARAVGLSLLAPRKKVTVLMIGNHSAGKSTFINWYVEEHIQRTGVAIETQGFTFVTSGKKRESLTGNATLHLYPHFKPLAEIPGLVDYLGTEISTSKQKKFPLVTFVDTPGLVDGDMKYPFDVNMAIQWLGELADLIFVFFDPIGQALCKRTLNLVEHLNENHSDRMRFYLSKADEAGHESDRQRVMMQIVQELCKRPGLNKTCFDMPTIYIPNPNKPSRCVNQVEEVCKDIEKTINQTIQNTLNTLEKDCERIAELTDRKLAIDAAHSRANLRARGRSCMFTLVGLLVPLVLVVNFLASGASLELIQGLLGPAGSDTLALYLVPVRQVWSSIPQDLHWHALFGILIFCLILLLLARVTTRIRPRLDKREKKRLVEHRDYVMNCVKTKKQALYKEYLQQSAGDFADM